MIWRVDLQDSIFCFFFLCSWDECKCSMNELYATIVSILYVLDGRAIKRVPIILLRQPREYMRSTVIKRCTLTTHRESFIYNTSTLPGYFHVHARANKKNKRRARNAKVYRAALPTLSTSRPFRHALEFHQPHRGQPRQHDLYARSVQRDIDRQRLLPRLSSGAGAPHRGERRTRRGRA